MQKPARKKVLAAVEELLFTVKIHEAAKRAGIDVLFLKSEKDVLDNAKDNPLLIILDLNNDAVHPLKLLGKLKSNTSSKSISVIGYLSHLDAALKQKAIEAGCDVVLARSAFSQNLQQILKRHVGTF